MTDQIEILTDETELEADALELVVGGLCRKAGGEQLPYATSGESSLIGL